LQLNNCAQNGDRAKFALLLSMLSSDVTDQKQIEGQSVVDVNPAVEGERMMRMNEYTATNNAAALRLEICMADERSIKVGDVDFISEPVFLNNSHLQQLKLHEQKLVKPTLSTNTETSTTNSINESTANNIINNPPHTISLLDVLNSYDASKPLKIKPAA